MYEFKEPVLLRRLATSHLITFSSLSASTPRRTILVPPFYSSTKKSKLILMNPEPKILTAKGEKKDGIAKDRKRIEKRREK